MDPCPFSKNPEVDVMLAKSICKWGFLLFSTTIAIEAVTLHSVTCLGCAQILLEPYGYSILTLWSLGCIVKSNKSCSEDTTERTSMRCNKRYFFPVVTSMPLLVKVIF